MPEMKKSSVERYLELKNLVKLYLGLVVVVWLFILIVKVPVPMNMPLDHNIINMAKFYIQSIIGNQNVLQLYMLGLLLYTGFVIMETLVFLRDGAARLYLKYKNSKAVH